MPKKTKKQKIKIKEQRINTNQKIQNTGSLESQTILKKSEAPDIFSFSFQAKSHKNHTTTSHDASNYLQQDLLRTSILSFTAIGTLIVLSLILHGNF